MCRDWVAREGEEIGAADDACRPRDGDAGPFVVSVPESASASAGTVASRALV